MSAPDLDANVNISRLGAAILCIPLLLLFLVTGFFMCGWAPELWKTLVAHDVVGAAKIVFGEAIGIVVAVVLARACAGLVVRLTTGRDIGLVTWPIIYPITLALGALFVFAIVAGLFMPGWKTKLLLLRTLPVVVIWPAVIVRARQFALRSRAT